MKNALGVLIIMTQLLFGQSNTTESANPPETNQGFLIDKPGTITFTVGVKIKGKVEKPQVMIFLPKEDSWHKKMDFDRSFRDNLLEPLPFSPKTQ